MFDLWTLHIIITTSNPLHKSLPISTISSGIITIDNKLITRPKAMVINLKISRVTHFQITPITNNIHANHSNVTFTMF